MSHVAIPGRTAYCAGKTSLLGFSRALALELAPEEITVNSISPGPFATKMTAPLMQNPELSQQFLSKIPLGRWGNLRKLVNSPFISAQTTPALLLERTF